jgi:hypothetical protein
VARTTAKRFCRIIEAKMSALTGRSSWIRLAVAVWAIAFALVEASLGTRDLLFPNA